jgi:hypothetical protein
VGLKNDGLTNSMVDLQEMDGGWTMGVGIKHVSSIKGFIELAVNFHKTIEKSDLLYQNNNNNNNKNHFTYFLKNLDPSNSSI